MGAIPIRGAGILHLLLSSVTSRFPMAATVGFFGIEPVSLFDQRHRFFVPTEDPQGTAHRESQGWPLAATAPPGAAWP
jgi:hypothetical protein